MASKQQKFSLILLVTGSAIANVFEKQLFTHKCEVIRANHSNSDDKIN